VLLKGCDIRGVFWGSWTKREPQAQHALLSDVARWAAEGKLSGHVHATFPLDDIAAAMKLISDRKVMGKIVLIP
jgi:NADPH:quinone reductase